MSKPLRYFEYQKEWKEHFEQIRDVLDYHLSNYILDIIHVGSTSVESLGAKPIIDIDIVYEENIDIIIKILEQNNYEYEGFKGIEGRHAFRRKTDDLPYHHLYACHTDARELKRHLSFKRALQNNPTYRKEYMELKQELIRKNSTDRMLYSESKTDLIEKILKEVSQVKSIVLAGGCFWGVEAYFKMIDGVVDTEVGYIDGDGPVTYKEVCNSAGHTEAVLIKYDNDALSLKEILDHLFNIIDPTSINKQGNDRGIQYRTGIYNYLDEDLEFIENYINIRQKEYKKPIVLDLKKDLVFYAAEDYHQDYLDKNVNGYCHVDLNSHDKVK